MTHPGTAPVLIRPTTACPRCSSSRIVVLLIDDDSALVWRECEECRHLWALPQGWTSHRDVPDSVVNRE